MEHERPDPDQLLARSARRRRRPRGAAGCASTSALGRRRQDVRDADRGARAAQRRQGRAWSASSRRTGARRPRRCCRTSPILPRDGDRLPGPHAARVRSRRARSRASPALILVDELAHTNVAGLAPSQALAGHRRAARGGHRRLHDAQRPAPREPERRRRRHHRHHRVGDGARLRSSTRPTRWCWSTSPADDLLARLKAGKVYLPEQIERAAQQLLPQGQPDGAARARAAPHRRPRRGRRPGLPHRQVDRARMEDRGLAAVLHRPRRRRRRRRAQRRAARHAARRRMDGGLRRDAGAAAAAARASASASCGRVKLAQDLGAKTAILSGSDPARRADRVRADAQLLEDRRRARPRRSRCGRGRAASARRVGELAPDIDLIEVGRGDAAGRASRRREPRRRGERRPAARRQAPCAIVWAFARVRRRRRSSRTPLHAVLRPRQHRDAVPAHRRARRGEVRTRSGGARRVRQRRVLRLLLRAAALLVRRQRRPVPADVRGDARRRADHRRR